MSRFCLLLLAYYASVSSSSSSYTTTYPVAPWLQRGTAYVQTMEVDVKTARAS